MNISNMGTFEKNSSWSSSSEITKFPIQRLEPSIQTFLKMIETDLDRLKKHRLNIEKYSRIHDWTNLNKEQINTTRTVQQIAATVREIEKTRRQIQDKDLFQFDERIEHMKSTAIIEIKEFVEVQREDNSITSADLTEEGTLSHPLLPNKHVDDVNVQLLDSGMEQLQIKPTPENTEAMESWENLHHSLIELDTMVHQFSSEVHGQQEKIDNIEDNIESAHANINEGTRHLGMKSKLKAGVLPVAGALIGTLVAGPIGLVAGAKIGLIGVAAGGALGFAGGNVVKSRQNDITNIEMRNLSEKTSKESPTTDANCNSWNPLNWMKGENKQ